MEKSRAIVSVSVLGVVAAALVLWMLRGRESESRAPLDPAEPAHALAVDAEPAQVPPSPAVSREPVLAAPATSPAPAAEQVRVRGLITDQQGQPIAGVRVLGEPAPARRWLLQPIEGAAHRGELERPAESASEGDGSFELSLTRSTEGHLALRHARFAGLDRVFAMPVDAHELDLGQLTLTPGMRLVGRVVDEGGRPIAGAQLVRTGTTDFQADWRLDWNALPVAKSAADGSFVLESLALGRIALEVRAAGFVAERRELVVAALDPPELRVELRPAATITGRVVGAPEGQGLQVQTWCSETREQILVDCAEDGSFTLDGLPPEVGELHLAAVRRAAKGTVGPFGSVTLSPSCVARPGDRGVEIVVPAPVTYRVRVVDAATNANLPAARVGLLNDWGLPDERGETAQEGAGVHALTARLPWSEGSALSVTHPGYEGVALGELPFVPGEPQDLGTLALNPLEETRVRVLDAAGQPLAGTRVRAAIDDQDEWHDTPTVWDARTRLPAAADLSTGADGTVSVPLSNGQDYLVTVEHPNHALLVHRLSVHAHPPGDLELHLTRGGTVTILCNDARTGAPLGRTLIRHKHGRDADDARYLPDISLDEAGRVQLAHLPAGMHAFWIDEEPEAEWVEVTEGAALEVRLTHSPRESVRLHGIVSELGQPLVGALVRASVYEVATGLDGSYEVPDLRPGGVDLLITHPQRGAVHVLTVELSAPDTRVDVNLELHALSGSVRDAEGHPLAEAKVWLTRAQDGRYEALMDERNNPLELTTSASDGTFRLENVQGCPDLYLVAARQGFLPARLGPLEPGSGEPLEVTLARGATLEVEVRASQELLGATLDAIWLGSDPLALDDREQAGELRPHPDGDDGWTFRFEALHPGPWAFEFRELLSFDETPLLRTEVRLDAGDNPRLVLGP